jgi:hypothetical protein
MIRTTLPIMNDEPLIAELERHREFARQCFVYGAQQNIQKQWDIVKSLLKEHAVFGEGGSRYFATKQLMLDPYSISYNC